MKRAFAERPFSSRSAVSGLRSLILLLGDSDAGECFKVITEQVAVPALEFINRFSFREAASAQTLSWRRVCVFVSFSSLGPLGGCRREANNPVWGGAVLNEGRQLFHFKLFPATVVWKALACEATPLLRRLSERQLAMHERLAQLSLEGETNQLKRLDGAAEASATSVEGLLELSRLYTERVAAPLSSDAGSAAAEEEAECWGASFRGSVQLLSLLFSEETARDAAQEALSFSSSAGWIFVSFLHFCRCARRPALFPEATCLSRETPEGGGGGGRQTSFSKR